MSSQTQDFVPHVFYDEVNDCRWAQVEANHAISVDDYLLDYDMCYHEDGEVVVIVGWKELDDGRLQRYAYVRSDRELPAVLKDASLIDIGLLQHGRSLTPLRDLVLSQQLYRVDDCRPDHAYSYYVIAGDDPKLFVHIDDGEQHKEPPFDSASELLALTSSDENTVRVDYQDTPDMRQRYHAWIKEGRVVIWDRSESQRLYDAEREDD